MDSRYLAIAILTVCLAVLLWFDLSEPFATKDNKAQAIYDWFKGNPNPKYITYRRSLGGKSNIVEYEDVRRLMKKKPNFTLDDVKGTMQV